MATDTLNDDKLTPAQFAAKIKSKYPAYKDMDDMELVNKIIEKYPTYADQVDFNLEKKNQNPTSDATSEGQKLDSEAKVEDGSSATPQDESGQLVKDIDAGKYDERINELQAENDAVKQEDNTTIQGLIEKHKNATAFSDEDVSEIKDGLIDPNQGENFFDKIHSFSQEAWLGKKPLSEREQQKNKIKRELAKEQKVSVKDIDDDTAEQVYLKRKEKELTGNLKQSKTEEFIETLTPEEKTQFNKHFNIKSGTLKAKSQGILLENEGLKKDAEPLVEEYDKIEAELKEIKANHDETKEDYPEEYHANNNALATRYNELATNLKELRGRYTDNLEEFNNNNEDLLSVGEEIDLFKRNYGWWNNFSGKLNIATEELGLNAAYILNDMLLASNPMQSANALQVKQAIQDEKGFLDRARNNLRRPKSLDNINGFEDAVEWGLDLVAEQAPNTVLMAATGGASLAVMGLTAAGGKLYDLEQEEIAGEADYTKFEKYFASFITGTAEALSEKISLGQINKAKRVFGAGERGNIVGSVKDYLIKTFKKDNIGGYAKDILEEGGSEALSQLAENITDKYFLGKDLKLTEGLSDAFLSGAFMSGVVYKAPAFAGGLIRPYVSKDTNEKIGDNFNGILRINQELKNDLKPQTKKALEAKRESLVDKNKELLDKDIKKIDNLSSKDKGGLLAIENETYKLRKKAEEINNDNISEKAKEVLLGDIKSNLETLQAKKESILNPVKETNAKSETTATETKEQEMETTPSDTEAKERFEIKTKQGDNVTVEIDNTDKSETPLKNREYGNIVKVKAKDASGKVIGEFTFFEDKDGNYYASHAEVDENHRKQGIASSVYNGLKKQGLNIIPAKVQTKGGKKLWDKLNNTSESKQEVAVTETKHPDYIIQGTPMYVEGSYTREQQKEDKYQLENNLSDEVFQKKKAISRSEDPETAIKEYNEAKKKRDDFEAEIERKKKVDKDIWSVLDEVESVEKSATKKGDNYEFSKEYKKDPRLAAIKENETARDFVLSDEYIEKYWKKDNPNSTEDDIVKFRDGQEKNYNETINALKESIKNNPKFDLSKIKGVKVETKDNKKPVQKESNNEEPSLEEMEGFLSNKVATDNKNKTFEGRKTRALKTLSKLFPKVKIVIHKTNDDYLKATGSTTKDKGEYNPDTKTIHINLVEADATTIAHEVFHAVLLESLNSNKLARESTLNMLNSLGKTFKSQPEIKNYLDDFASNYEENLKSEEKVAELIGMLAANYEGMNVKSQNIVKRWLKDLLAKLGLTKELDSILSDDNEMANFLDTLAKKVVTGEALTKGDLSVFEGVEKNKSIETINKRFQANFTDPVMGYEFTYDKNGDSFLNLEKAKYITRDKSIQDFNGKYLFLHQPDGAFSGTISHEGEVLVEGKGGVYYPIKFHKDGYFWASTSTTAKKMASDLNKTMKQNKGTIYMALTSAPYDKLLSSTTMSNAILDFMNNKANSRKFKVNKKEIQNAIIEASKTTIEVTTPTGGVKRVGLGIKLRKTDNFESNLSIIKEKLGAKKSSFGDRKMFSETLISKVADILKKNDASKNQFASFFSEGIQNKYFKGVTKTGKLSISKANMIQAFSEMFTEPILKDGVDRNKGGQIYAVLELNGSVKPIKSDKHESYPMAIQSADKNNKVKLHLLKDRKKWHDVAEDFETNKIVSKDRRMRVFPTSGVSVRALKINTNTAVKKQEDTPSTRKQLIPESAKLTKDVRGNLATARQMEAAKKSVKAIRIATGWERGADTKWRYEIGNDNVKIKSKKNGKLSEVLHYPEMFKAMPKAKAINVHFNENLSYEAAFVPSKNRIVVNPLLGNTLLNIIHELQHWVQHASGFEFGGSEVSVRKQLDELIANGGNKSLLSKLKTQLLATKPQKEAIKKTLERLKEVSSKSNFDLYESIAGEVEARNVETRFGMSDELRRETTLQETEDVAREDQIFFENFKEAAKNVDAPQARKQKIWKSTAQEGVAKLKLQPSKPKVWVNKIAEAGGRGTKQELDWIGLEDFLNDWMKDNGKKSVPKEVVEQYIIDNDIEIEEVEKKLFNENKSEEEISKLREERRNLELKYLKPLTGAVSTFVKEYNEITENIENINLDSENWKEKAKELHAQRKKMVSDFKYVEYVDITSQKASFKPDNWIYVVGKPYYENNPNYIKEAKELDGLINKKEKEFEKKTKTQPKYSTYQLEGGENYREVLLTLPKKEPQVDKREILKELKQLLREEDNLGFETVSEALSAIRTDADFAKNWDVESPRLIELGNQYKDIVKDNKEYKSSHWDESNILAHVRMNERTLPNGERVLFIEEVQSDWAQDGKKKGFVENKSLKGVEPKLLEDNKKTNIKRWGWDVVGSPVIYFDSDIKGGDQYSVDFYKNGSKRFEIFPTYEASLNFAKEVDISQSNAVPQMPYKKTDQWVGMAMRRVMQMASNEGFDRIAWVTGEQSADRYSLSSQVDKIDVAIPIDNYRQFYILLKNNSDLAFTTDNEGLITDSSPSEFKGKNLEEVVGKEMAKKLLEAKEETTLQDVDLEVGGEGMKTFYNSILPKVAKKEAQRFDKKAKVDVIEINTPEEAFPVKVFKIIGDPTSNIDDINYEHKGYYRTRKEAEDFIKKQADPSLYEIGGDEKGTKQLSIPITEAAKEKLDHPIPRFQKNVDSSLKRPVFGKKSNTNKTKENAFKTIDEAANWLKNALPKVDDPDVHVNGMSQDQLIDLIAKFAKELVSKSIDANEAIKQVIKSLKEKYPKIKDKLDAIDINKVKDKIEPKTTETKTKTRSYLGRALEEYANIDNMVEAIKEGGTEYETQSHRKLNPVADAIIDKALKSANPLKAFKDIKEKIGKTKLDDFTKNPKLASLLSLVSHKVLYHLKDIDINAWAEFNLYFASLGTNFGQFISAMQESAAPEAIMNHALEVLLSERANKIGNYSEDIEVLRKEINELQKQVAEEVLKSEGFQKKLTELLSKPQNITPPTTTKGKRIAAKRLASRLRAFKSSNSNRYTFSQVIPITPVIDGALETIATALENSVALVDAIEKALNEIRNSKAFKSYQPHQQAQIEKLFLEDVDKLSDDKIYTNKQIEDVVKNHYSKGNKGQALAKILFNKLGVAPEIAQAIEAEVVAKIEAKLASKLRQKFNLDKDGNPKDKKAIVRKTEIDSVLEGIQYGALDSNNFQNHFAERFGFGKFTPEQISKLEELVGYIFEYNGSEMSFRYKKQLADFVAAMRPMDAKKFYEILHAATIRAALTGSKTILVNIPIGSLLSYTFQQLPKFAMNPKAYLAARKAWKKAGMQGMGTQSFLDIFKSGFNMLDLAGQKFDEKGIADGDVFDYMLSQDMTEVFKSYKNPIKGTVAYAGLVFAKTFKLANFARAFDAIMNHKGSEMTQFIDEYNEIAKDLKGKGLPRSSSQIAKIVEDNLGYSNIKNIKQQVAEEIAQIKSFGHEVPRGFRQRRTKEIMEESRNPDKVKEAADWVKFITLMNAPDGLLGRVYSNYTGIFKIKSDKESGGSGKGQYISNGLKYITNASLGLFLRIGVTSSQAILRNIPFFGLTSTLTGRFQQVQDGNKTTWKWKRLTTKQMNARLREHAISTAMLAGAFFSMFMWDDDEEEWVLKPEEDRWLDVTGMGTGKYWVDSELGGRDTGGVDKRKNLMIRAKINGDWVDVVPARLLPNLLPFTSILGGLRDRIKVKEKLNDEMSDFETTPINKEHIESLVKYGINDIIDSTTELSFNSLPQFFKNIQYAGMKNPDDKMMARIGVGVKTASRPLKTALQPNIIRDMYYEMLSLGEANMRTGTPITKALVSGFYGLEYFNWGEHMEDRTDMFGYEIKHTSSIKNALNEMPFIEFQKKNDWRYDEPAWRVMQEHAGVVIEPHWKSGVPVKRKLFEAKVWGENMKAWVENNSEYLKTVPDNVFKIIMDEYSSAAKEIARYSIEPTEEKRKKK